MRTDLAHAVEELVLVDTHEHLSAEDEWIERGPDILQDLFWPHYAGADLLVAGADPAAVERLQDPASGSIATRFAGVQDAWAAMQHTGYGEAVRLVAREVYGLEELTPPGLDQAQAQLEGLRRPGELLRLLRDVARLDHVQIDTGERPPRVEVARPDFFLHDLSWLSFAAGEIEPREIFEETGVELRTLDDLRLALATVFERHAPTAIAVKSQHAYRRTLRWEERADADAARAFDAIVRGGAADATTRLVLGDWCLARGVELAIEHDLPIKLHTGYHARTGSMTVDWIKAGHLCPLLARYPAARFVLMHISYPYGDELVAIAKHYPNVWVDLCWAWSADPYSTAAFVRRFLHAVPSSKLFAFGGDTQWPTNVLAHAVQARRWLTRTLEAEIATGDLTERQAIAIARRLMRENQYACFDVEGTRAALGASAAYSH